MTPSAAAHLLAEELEQVIEFEGPESIAAFIGEPIIGGGGVIVPPDEYWPLIRQICDKYGILLIQDEVITGFGRTGHDVRLPELGHRAGHHDDGEGDFERLHPARRHRRDR